MVQQTLHYGDLRIPYKVFYLPGKSRKLAIHVHPDGSVRVDAPPDIPLDEIKTAISHRARWLYVILPNNNGHIAKRLVVPQTLLG